jgi:hypothetical protein
MAGARGRSGGQNRLSVEEHHRRGTYQASRHGERDDVDDDDVPPADRRFVLQGLPPGAKTIADRLLSLYRWHAAPEALFTLRAYAWSCARLERLQTQRTVNAQAVAREVQTNVALLRALQLGAADDSTAADNDGDAVAD